MWSRFVEERSTARLTSATGQCLLMAFISERPYVPPRILHLDY